MLLDTTGEKKTQNGWGSMQELKTCFHFQPSKQNFFRVLGIIRKLNLQQIEKGGMQEQGTEEVKG